MHRGDRWLRETPKLHRHSDVAREHLVPFGDRRFALVGLLLKVVARAERTTCATHDDDAHLTIGLGTIERCLQLIDECVRHRVELVGTIERDPRGWTAALVENEVFRHTMILVGRGLGDRPQPWLEVLETEPIGLKEVDHEGVRLVAGDRQSIPIRPQEDVDCTEGKALVAIDEGMVDRKTLEQCGSLGNDVVVIPHLWTDECRFQRTVIAQTRASTMPIQQDGMDKQRIGDRQVRGLWPRHCAKRAYSESNSAMLSASA